jgi:hypothetical protein
MLIYHGLRQGEDDMLIADSSEKRVLEKYPEISGAKVIYSDVLEELTGADLMITNLSAPLVPALLSAHINSGAILVQVKRGNDLPASVGPRANSSLARMIDAGTFAPWQRVLLFVGTLGHDAETGAAIINGQHISHLGPHTYWAIQGTLEKWGERGGSVSFLPRMAMLPGWVSIKLGHLQEYANEPVKSVYKMYPALTETVDENVHGVILQKLKLIKDWRNTILTLPGLGEKRVELVYQYIKQTTDGSLMQALFVLTDETLITQIPGLGAGTARKIRDWFGIDEVLNLSLEVRKELNEQE